MSEEISGEYDVRMTTSVGIRLGHMSVYQNLGEIKGYLEILNHSEPFKGTIDDEGNCELIGKIIALMRTISYVAVGRITPDSLELSIKDGRHILGITGTLYRP